MNSQDLPRVPSYRDGAPISAVALRMECTSNTKDFFATNTVTLSAVTSGSEENKKFFKYTPSGFCNFCTVNEEASKLFERGAIYEVTFRKVK